MPILHSFSGLLTRLMYTVLSCHCSENPDTLEAVHPQPSSLRWVKEHTGNIYCRLETTTVRH